MVTLALPYGINSILKLFGALLKDGTKCLSIKFLESGHNAS